MNKPILANQIKAWPKNEKSDCPRKTEQHCVSLMEPQALLSYPSPLLMSYKKKKMVYPFVGDVHLSHFCNWVTKRHIPKPG